MFCIWRKRSAVLADQCSSALSLCLQVIIAGALEAAETQALMAAAHGVFAPDRVVLPIDPCNEASKAWFQQFNPEALAMIEGATKEVNAYTLSCSGSSNLVALQGDAFGMNLIRQQLR